MVANVTHSSRLLTRASILLKADEGEDGEAWPDEQIASTPDVGLSTICRVRERVVVEGVRAAVTGYKAGKPRERIRDARGEAHLVAIACSEVPNERTSWTLSLLKDEMVAERHVEVISSETNGAA